jgi:mevalonate kinase
MIAIEESFMKLEFVAAIFALAIPALAHAQQSGPNVPKPTKADAQNVVQIITSDKVKTQAYCDLDKLEGRVKAAEQKNDAKTLEALSEQAQSLIDKLGPEYFKLMDGLEKVDPNSSEAKEFMSILSELDKRCTN